jgi:hypothetical protein
MLWLNARSFVALGITTATRNGSAGAGVGGASVAGASVAAGGSVATGACAPQALNTIENPIKRERNIKRFFICFSLISY